MIVGATEVDGGKVVISRGLSAGWGIVMGDGGAGRRVSGGSWLSWIWELKLSDCMMGDIARSRTRAGWRSEGSSGL